jgi:hypothetical protein
MSADIAAAISAVTLGKELVKLVIKRKIDTAIHEKALELNAAVASLQSEYLDLLSRYQNSLREADHLKQQLINMENWQVEKAKYSLSEIAPSVFVYAIKDNQRAGEPPHWLCPQCYEQKQKSILQRCAKTIEGTTYQCLNCKAEVTDHTDCIVPIPGVW